MRSVDANSEEKYWSAQKCSMMGSIHDCNREFRHSKY